MNKRGNSLTVVSIIFLILFVIFLTVVSIISLESRKICKNECADRGTRFSDVVPNGEFFNTRDLCVCYYQNKTESFLMENLK